MDYLLRVTAEEKEDVTGDGQEPELPTTAGMAVVLQDHLTDITKHDGQLGWRITAVSPA
jgi:hypothetical protein